MAYTVKAVADVAGISIRTLHHYDEIGLLKPAQTSAAQRLASLMDRGAADPDVQEAIRQHHQMINDRFYTCSPEVYRGLGDLYVQDERFTANIDKSRPGLAQFMQQAMHVYCDQLEGK